MYGATGGDQSTRESRLFQGRPVTVWLNTELDSHIERMILLEITEITLIPSPR
jgi:hypothetical protein